MMMLDNVTSETRSRFGIGPAAEPLTRELLQVMTGGPGGLGGFLDRIRNAGMTKEVASFLGGGSEEVIPPKTVDTVLGDATVTGISQRVGLTPSEVSSAAGFEIPKLIGLLTPGGRLPSALPNEVQTFVGGGGAAAMALRGGEQVRPLAMAEVSDATHRNIWPWVILGLVLLGLLIGLLLARRPHVVVHAPAPVIVQAPAVPAPATVGAVNDLNTFLSRTVLNFRTGSAELPAGADPTLAVAADRIKALPAGTVVNISGHTDNVGDAAANMSLSQRRAEAVRDALVRDGVNPAMLTATGYGQTMPVASNDTATGRFMNRRIAFSVAGQAPATGTTPAPAETPAPAPAG